MENNNNKKKPRASKVQIKSIFEQIANQVFKIKDVKEIKETIIKGLSS
jgi:hypothetical protein